MKTKTTVTESQMRMLAAACRSLDGTVRAVGFNNGGGYPVTTAKALVARGLLEQRNGFSVTKITEAGREMVKHGEVDYRSEQRVRAREEAVRLGGSAKHILNFGRNWHWPDGAAGYDNEVARLAREAFSAASLVLELGGKA